jgi:4-amino-4-deoxy-L-arabinose transferase-like glycosyltransferase
MTERRWLLALIGLFSVLLFLELPGSRLIEPDEARYAEIPREMIAAGDWVTPRLNGTRYYEKPPLLYWANAASFKLLGETPFAARLPARYAALGTAALIALSLGGDWGLWAALILLSAPLSFILGRYNVTDGVLTFGMTLALVSMRAFFRDERPMWSLAFLGLGCALAVLAKGLIGIVLPGLVFLLYIGVMGEWRRLGRLFLSPAPFVLLAVAAPWFVLMEQRNPGFSQVFFIREHFQRFATNEAKREGPIYYFVLAFIGGFLPWTIPFGVWLSKARPRWKTPDREWLRERADTILFVLWFAVILVFFSVSKSKLLPYILPAFPAAAALTARFIITAERRPRALFAVYALVMSIPFFVALFQWWPHSGGKLSDYFGIGAVGGAFVLGLASWIAVGLASRSGKQALMAAAVGWGGLYLGAILELPRLSKQTSVDDLARAAVAVPGARVVAYRTYPQGLAWALKDQVVVADFTGELASDGVRAPEIFWSGDEFWRRWRAGEPMAVVLKRRDFDKLSGVSPAPKTVAANQTYLVVTNVPVDSLRLTP